VVKIDREPMEENILFFFERRSSATLDLLFRISHEIGTGMFCTILVAVVATMLVGLGRHREAVVWAVLGISTYALQAGVKLLVGRARPLLWSGPVLPSGYSFPSGHALAAATLYPLLAYTLTRDRPSWRRPAMVAGVVVAAWVGIGRMYLGVHWPSDVLAGWAIGFLQLVVALKVFERVGQTPAELRKSPVE
jgi:undecaprenyl-diphosphatase